MARVHQKAVSHRLPTPPCVSYSHPHQEPVIIEDDDDVFPEGIWRPRRDNEIVPKARVPTGDALALPRLSGIDMFRFMCCCRMVHESFGVYFGLC